MPSNMREIIPSGDFQLFEVQQNVKEVAEDLVKDPVFGGVLVEDQDLLAASSFNLVPHGLGREAIGWVVRRNKDQYANLYEYTPTSSDGIDLTRYLPLVTEFDVTVDLVIF